MQASPLRGSRWAGKGAGIVSVSAVTRVVEFAGDATVSGGQWVLWAPLKPEGHCHRLSCHCCLVVRGCRHVRRFPAGHRLSHQGFSIAGTASAVPLDRPSLGVRSPMSRYTDVRNSPASQSVEQQNLC